MKKVTLNITSKEYTITLDDDFAAYFEKEAEKVFGSHQNIDIKTLLNAFVQKCYDGYTQEKNLGNILDTIDGSLS